MNKTTQNYFINLFKRKKRLLALYTFIVFMAYPFLLLTDVITNGADGLSYLTEIIFVVCLVSLGALGLVLPLFTFKFVFVKKNVDTYFSIPINRNHLFNAHFIAPILGTIIPILASYLIGGLFLIPDNGIDAYFKLLIILLMAFVIFIVIYSVNTFFILKCNNIIDASVISAAIGVIPLMLYGTMYTFLHFQVVRNGTLDSYVSKFPQLVLDLLSPYRGLALIGSTIETHGTRIIDVTFNGFDYVLFIYYIVIGIIFVIQAKNSFKVKKGEDAEQLSTHFLTYPLLSNLALITLILNFNFTEYEITTAIMIMIALFVIYMIINGIAHRSFKVNLKMIIKFVVLFIVINTFNIVSKETEFFGLNRRVIDYKKYYEVEFTLDYYDYDTNKQITNYLDIDTESITSKEIKLFEYIEILQKEKSLAFKEDDYDTLYPNEDSGDYNLNIKYNALDNNDNNNSQDEFVYYQLSKKNYDELKSIMLKIEGIESWSSY